SGPGTYRARSDAANQMTRDNIRTALGETRDTREPVTRERAATLKMPCLLIGGGRSPPRFAPVLAALESAVPGARLVVIPDAGHTMYRTHAAVFNDALLAFMDAHCRPSLRRARRATTQSRKPCARAPGLLRFARNDVSPHFAEHGLAAEHSSPMTAMPWISISMPGRAKLETVISALPG